MRGYKQFCPVAKACEVFVERWTPLIMRELLMGSTRFNELERGLPRISRSVLSQRLKQMEQDGLIERRITPGSSSPEYVPTPIGSELFDIIILLGEWGARWLTSEIDPEDHDPTLLLWDMHRRVDADHLPSERVVVRVDFTGLFNQSHWLVIETPEVEVCYTDPGLEVDMIVTTDTAALHRVWAGRESFANALRERRIELDGPRELVRGFPEWFQLSVFAHIKPQRVA